MKNKGYKFYLEADISTVKETVALKKEVSSVIDLPSHNDKQPDLSYFSSIFVSTGTNLNHAHFLASEIVLADNTIPGKAVDIEHVEDQIIGHIYKHEFIDTKGNKLDLSELQNKEISSLDEQDLHVEIASVVYKTRFPDIAEEINNGNWKVSMEAYFTSYDILIGKTIMSPDEAMALGFDVANEELYGRSAKLVKAGEVLDEGKIARVLRGICFSGVGIVKNPANPPSVILETASEDDVIILDYDNIENSSSNKVTSSKIDTNIKFKKEKSDVDYNALDTVGVCVNYSKELNDSVVKDQNSKIIETEWCSKYSTTCPTAGNATSIGCLRNTVTAAINDIISSKIEAISKDSKIEELTIKLIKVMKSN